MVWPSLLPEYLTIDNRTCQEIFYQILTAKFRFSGQMPSHQSTGHCEPVTDVTGVAIPYFFGIYCIFDEKCLKFRGIATPVCALARNDRIFQTVR